MTPGLQSGSPLVFQYRWYEKSLDSPEQLAAMEAELAGLWERFGFHIEVSRE